MNEIELKRSNHDREIQHRNMMEIVRKYHTESDGRKQQLKTTRMRSIINSYRLAEAYKADSKVAYVGEQFPTEIVFGFNLIAWNIESIAILFTQSVDTNEFFSLTQENGLSRDICSFLRGPYGLMLANCYPNPDIILANDQPCDCLSKLKYMAGKIYDRPFFSLHTPNTLDADAILYLVRQMRSIMSRITDVFGIQFDETSFRSVVAYSNQAKEYYCKTIELLKTNKLPSVSRELHEIFGMNCFGLKETVQLCKTLYEETLEMIRKSEMQNSKKRVLWVGQTPESSHELMEYLNRELEIQFWAPLWGANLVMLDDHDPLKSIAERAILYHWHSERLKKDVSGICDQFGVEGIILASMWGCRNMMGVSPMLMELAREKHLKCIMINIDWMDRNNFSFPHVKNRMDAFLEIMK